ncbi:hypothetical protein DFH06DRAFT_1153158 [Mycena polygramma]|nr:hypothetical protein DFH06DRAFT_1153158 [Mycena polygramma]
MARTKETARRNQLPKKAALGKKAPLPVMLTAEAQKANIVYEYESIEGARVQDLEWNAQSRLMTGVRGQVEYQHVSSWEPSDELDPLAVALFWENAETDGRDHTDIGLFRKNEVIRPESESSGPVDLGKRKRHPESDTSSELTSSEDESDGDGDGNGTQVFALKRKFFAAGTVSEAATDSKYLIAFKEGGRAEVTLDQMRSCNVRAGDKLCSVLNKATVTLIQGKLVKVTQRGAWTDFKVAATEIAKSWGDRMLKADSIMPSGIKPRVKRVADMEQQSQEGSWRTENYVTQHNEKATRVFAMYGPNRCYYAAVLAYRVRGGKKFGVRFNVDGQFFEVDKVHLRQCRLRVGDSVQLPTENVIVGAVLESGEVEVFQQGDLGSYPIHETDIEAEWGDRQLDFDNVICLSQEVF